MIEGERARGTLLSGEQSKEHRGHFRTTIVRNKRERESSLNARSSLEVEVEGATEYEKLAIYATVLLRVRAMTLPIVRDNARRSHVALTRVNSTMHTILTPYLFTFHWDARGIKIVPKNERERKVY